ncbi:MAG: ATP-binding cassette domain-containing protein [Candidatus Bathyarchaeia archaeon]
MAGVRFEIEEAYYTPGRRILRSVSSSIDDGGLLLVAGPSGSGKTTLLLALTGVLSNLLGGIVKGSSEIYGVNPLTPTGFRGVPRMVGAVLQDPERQLAMPTPWDEASFLLENLGYGDEEIGRTVEGALRRFGLLDKAHLHVEDLSSGEKRRLTFASAIVHGPKLLILDEPTASLDPWGIREVKRLVDEVRGKGSSVMVVEHKARHFIGEADRLLVIDKGTVRGEHGPGMALQEGELERLASLGIDARRPEVREPQRRPNGGVVLEVDSLDVGLIEDRPLIKEASFEVNRGEVISLVGPNGSGKTTLLKTLIGAVKPLSGSIRVKGSDISRMKRRKLLRSIFYIPQQPDHLFVASTLEGEIKEASRRGGLGSEEAEGMIPWYQELRGQSPYRLSFGQRMWLSIAIGGCYRPDIMLLDEPTAGLDYRLFCTLKGFVERLREKGLSLLIATHDARVVGELSDRALMIEDGGMRWEDRGRIVETLEHVAGVQD